MKEYLRPWKLGTLAVGILLLVLGARYYKAPDWDALTSVLIACMTYLAAPWSVRVIAGARWHLTFWMLLVTWFTVDGFYFIYWYFQDPNALVLRDANFAASLPLYWICGVVWAYPGSLIQFKANLLYLVRSG